MVKHKESENEGGGLVDILYKQGLMRLNYIKESKSIKPQCLSREDLGLIVGKITDKFHIIPRGDDPGKHVEILDQNFSTDLYDPGTIKLKWRDKD